MFVKLSLLLLSIFLLLNNVSSTIDDEFAADFEVLRERLNGLPETLIEKRLEVIQTILKSSFERAEAIIPVGEDMIKATLSDLKEHPADDFKEHVDFYASAVKKFSAGDDNAKGLKKLTGTLQKLDPIEIVLARFGPELKEELTGTDKAVALLLKHHGLEDLRALWWESNEKQFETVTHAAEMFLDSLTAEEQPLNKDIESLYEEIQAEPDMKKKMHKVLMIANLMAEKE